MAQVYVTEWTDSDERIVAIGRDPLVRPCYILRGGRISELSTIPFPNRFSIGFQKDIVERTMTDTEARKKYGTPPRVIEAFRGNPRLFWSSINLEDAAEAKKPDNAGDPLPMDYERDVF
ncbi:hypothetical protein [Candidatus Palauibacter sp.]|uniref:hypothetical protein n=1 Tax=Candidatus Palauibacter sp. TaxID=3101350 RepID=UPI003B01DEA2